MDSSSRLTDLAALLDLDVATTDVFVSVVAHSELNRDEIGKLLDKDRKAIDASLKTLLNRGLVREMTLDDETVIQPDPLLQLQLEPAVMLALEPFMPPTMRASQKLGIVKYHGLDGIRRAYVEVLEEARKTGDAILAFEKGEDANTLGASFIDTYVKRRIASGIEAFVLSPTSPADEAYKKEHEGALTHVKMLPDLDIGANINLVGDLVMSFSLEPPQGTLRRDAAEARSLRAIFHRVWDGIA